MAGHDDGDDFFSDDDLDHLPQNAFRELEENAIRQTQAAQLIKGPPSSNYGDDFDDDDLDDAEVFDAAQGRPFGGGPSSSPLLDSRGPRAQNHHAQENNLKSITGRPLKQELSSANPPVIRRPPPILPQTGTVAGHGGIQRIVNGPSGLSIGSSRRLFAVNETKSQQTQQKSGLVGSVQHGKSIIAAGSGRIEEAILQQGSMNAKHMEQTLEGEQIDENTSSAYGSLILLQKELEMARHQQDALKQELNLKSGEIAIVRSKQEKTIKEFERELTATRKLHAERTAQQQKELEAAKETQTTTATELEFLKRDLVEESEKVRNLRKANDKGKGNTELVATPKKSKTYGDGFDDKEIQLISPSKFHGKKSNPSTPTKGGGKRKRKALDSPSILLELSRDETPPHQMVLGPTAIIDEALLERIRQPDDRLNFLEVVFDHRPHRDQLRTLEQFASIYFPTTPGESLISIVLGKLPGMNQRKSSSEFAIELCELVISLWSRCLKEKYYEPLYLIIDLVTFALELKTTAMAPYLIDSLLPIAQLTCDIVAIPRFQREPYRQFDGLIDVSACLAVIHLAVLGCMGDKEHSIRVWRFMRLDFVLMMLSQHQPPQDFDMTLQLLSMSSMKDSIGPKAAHQEDQKLQAMYIIDRISLLLICSPTPPEGLVKHDPSVISNLHLQIVLTFDAFCQTEWGTEALALHKTAIGRLVKVLSDELDALYDYCPEHKRSAKLVCLIIRLLHHLLTKHDKSINMQKKLSEILGGNQKYFICLARLNFSEDDLVLDADIDPEIAECAHELLELAVTPEEGDAIHAAFSSP